MQALGKLSEKKQPWQNMVAICTTDIWDHILFDTQYVVAAPPLPNLVKVLYLPTPIPEMRSSFQEKHMEYKSPDPLQ